MGSGEALTTLWRPQQDGGNSGYHFSAARKSFRSITAAVGRLPAGETEALVGPAPPQPLADAMHRA